METIIIREEKLSTRGQMRATHRISTLYHSWVCTNISLKDSLISIFLICSGKRSEERGDAGVRSGEGIMVRRPRYRDYNDYNEEEASKKEEVDVNPWSFIDMESQKGTRRLL